MIYDPLRYYFHLHCRPSTERNVFLSASTSIAVWDSQDKPTPLRIDLTSSRFEIIWEQGPPLLDFRSLGNRQC